MFFTDKASMDEIKGTVFNRASSHFDPVTGYRWTPGITRIVRIIKGELIYDTHAPVNNMGFHSSYDYHLKKNNPNDFRLLVLGDSFTNCISIEKAWPEQLQNLLNSRPEFGRNIEVYGMPVDGGGLLNWYSEFTQLIQPKFEFDALMIADWGDDLERNFIVCHSDDASVYIQRFTWEDRPKSSAEFENVQANSKKLYEISTDEKIDQLVQQLKDNASPKPQTPEDWYRNWQGAEIPISGYSFSPETFIERYGKQRWDMLSEIITSCKDAGKPVIYSPLPTREGLLRIEKENVTLLHQAQGQGICNHFGIEYFDGYNAFNGIDPQAIIDFYWHKYDGHWGQGGSDLFAVKLTEWILNSQITK